MSQPLHPVDQLILDAASGARQLTPDELQQMLEHVVRAGFHLARNVPASGRAGLVWQGRVLTGSDRITSAEYHYLRHVVRFREWPLGTSFTDYLQSIQEIVLDPTSGVFSSRYRGQSQLGVVRESRRLRGAAAKDWVLLEYRLNLGHWVTCHQIPGPQDLRTPERTDFRWLRPPT